MWQKQSLDTRLFPELEWDKPERKDQAGRLLIIGGNLHGFAAPAKAYETAIEQGIGSVRIILPDALRRTLGPLWADAVFTESTPSGSFALDGKSVILQNIMWSDGLLLAGDTGRNSETAILLEEVVRSTVVFAVITKDSLDYFSEIPDVVLTRERTVVIGSFAQIQKLLSKSAQPIIITHSMQLHNIVEALEQATLTLPVSLVTRFNDTYIVAHKGKVSTSITANGRDIWRVETSARCAVNILHYPGKIYESLTDAVYKSLS